jgi:hypothetical protein
VLAPEAFTIGDFKDTAEWPGADGERVRAVCLGGLTRLRSDTSGKVARQEGDDVAHHFAWQH